MLTDDQDTMLGSMEGMPFTRELGRSGVNLTNFFAHTPVCCPSRSELLTGRYFHNIRDASYNTSANTSAEVHSGDTHLLLATPTTFMNDSGNAVGPLALRYGVDDPARIIIVHDELDLEPGVVRIKIGGGLAGHNGLRSISTHLKTQEFVRVRIGVGKPSSKEEGADHVLSRVPQNERQVLDIAVVTATEAVVLIVLQGAQAAMQQINAR